jgi:hypothetical protein
LASGITKEPADLTTVNAELKQFAGKSDLAEVLVTGLRRLDDDVHTVALHWPGTHAFYAPAAQNYSPLLFIEGVRQALSVVSHVGLDVPMDYRMSWEFLESEVAPDALRAGTDPATVEMAVTHESVTRRRSGSVRVSAHARATREDMPLGTARVNYTALPPAIYKWFRGGYADAPQAFARALPPLPPITPTLAGRTSERDVVLATGDGPRRWLLRADTSHPVLFDHTHDHIPGMVLLEAACQAVQADAAPERVTPVTVNSTFSRYVELDLPCWIVTEPADTDERGRRRQTVRGVQGDDVAFTIVIASETAVS